MTETLERSIPRIADLPDLCRVREAAAVLRVREDCVYDMVARGELRGARAGRKLLIPRAELQRLAGG